MKIHAWIIQTDSIFGDMSWCTSTFWLTHDFYDNIHMHDFYSDAQDYAWFLQRRSESRMALTTMSNITHNRCKLFNLLTLPVSRPESHRCTSPTWCLFYWEGALNNGCALGPWWLCSSSRRQKGQAWRRQERLLGCGARDRRIQLLSRHCREVWSKVVVMIIASSSSFSSSSSSSSSSSTPWTRGLEMRRGIMRIRFHCDLHCHHLHFHRRLGQIHQKQPIVNFPRQSCRWLLRTGSRCWRQW